MTELCERARLAREAAGKVQVAARPRRENFQRDETIQRRLVRLVNRAHAALADEFEDFQLRKKFCQIGDRGRSERRRSRRRAAFGRDAALQQAGGAKPFRHVRFQFRAALRTFTGNDLGGGGDRRSRWWRWLSRFACKMKDQEKGYSQQQQQEEPQAEQGNCGGFC